MSENVTLDRKGAVATVTLSRPERRNSLSDAMLTDLSRAFTELRDDDTTRVVIVTGAPPVFSAGADAPHARAKTDEERRRLFTEKKSQFRRLFERAQTALENLEQATICMVNGHAVGGGWGLTLAFRSFSVRLDRIVGARRPFAEFCEGALSLVEKEGG